MGNEMLELDNDFRALGPGTDQAHLAPDNFPQLGQLVHVSASEESSYWRLRTPA